jgi:acyl-CoA hydrolase
MISTHVQIVMPPHVSGANRLFGGQLMAWIDVIAAVEARRHTHRQVITVVVDNLRFLGPAYLDEVVRLDARVTWTGRTSLEVRVDSFVESLKRTSSSQRTEGSQEFEDSQGTERLINRAYLVFVALDDEGKPVPIPAFVPSTEEEKLEWEGAEQRRAQRFAAMGKPGGEQ